MKALVLAGGTGLRLRPFTHSYPKQLAPVANKPVLCYGLQTIRDAGITDVGIVVGDTARQIEDAVGDGSAFGLVVTYIPQESPCGLAHAVQISHDYLGDNDFVMYLGDNILGSGIGSLLGAFRRNRPAAQILLTQVQDPRAFGVAEVDADMQVLDLREKPVETRSNLAIVGVYVFSPTIHEAVRQLKPSQRGELEITDAIQWLVDSGHRVSSTIISGYWKDAGNVADLLEANRLVLEGVESRRTGIIDPTSDVVGRVVVEEGARVIGSRILGPAIIGARTRLTSSYIGPFTSIAEDCDINESEIQYSIVLRGASLERVRRVEESLIGHDARVTSIPDIPDTHRLILGDHSRVQISSLQRGMGGGIRDASR